MLKYFLMFLSFSGCLKKILALYLGLNSNTTKMEFSQYLGFLAFLTIFSIGFWLMMFLVPFAFYWVTGATIELIKERKAQKQLNENKN